VRFVRLSFVPLRRTGGLDRTDPQTGSGLGRFLNVRSTHAGIALYRIDEHGQLMSDIPYDHTTAPKPDIRPTRLGLEALLGGPTLTLGVRRAVINALEDAGLLNGGRPADSAPAADASGRLSIGEVDRAIAGFDDITREYVKSVLSGVNALAP
jgi:hypothetical protein